MSAYRVDVLDADESAGPLYTEYTEAADHDQAAAYGAHLAGVHGGDDAVHYADVWMYLGGDQAALVATVDIGGHVHQWDQDGECGCGCDIAMFAGADRWAGSAW